MAPWAIRSAAVAMSTPGGENPGGGVVSPCSPRRHGYRANRAMDMTLWLPEAEAALAQAEAGCSPESAGVKR